jgi:hypothetical protein
MEENKEDIILIMVQTSCNRERAINACYNHPNDLLDAILCVYESRKTCMCEFPTEMLVKSALDD